MSKNAPFHIGQKIIFVCKSNGIHNKGVVYTVESNSKCNKCGEWHTTTIETDAGSPGEFNCSFCEGFISESRHYGTDSKSFRPIQEIYHDATAEVLEKFKPFEGVEVDGPVKKIKELQTN